jgi:hypothetical protein
MYIYIVSKYATWYHTSIEVSAHSLRQVQVFVEAAWLLVLKKWHSVLIGAEGMHAIASHKIQLLRSSLSASSWARSTCEQSK